YACVMLAVGTGPGVSDSGERGLAEDRPTPACSCLERALLERACFSSKSAPPAGVSSAARVPAAASACAPAPRPALSPAYVSASALAVGLGAVRSHAVMIRRAAERTTRSAGAPDLRAPSPRAAPPAARRWANRARSARERASAQNPSASLTACVVFSVVISAMGGPPTPVSLWRRAPLGRSG